MLEIKNLSKSYLVGRTEYKVLKGVNMEVKKGEFVAVMGPSGSGKTTLLNCISCFIPYDTGKILLKGKKIAELSEQELADVRNTELSFVFQDFMLLDGMTVFENVCIPKIIKNENQKDMEEKAGKLLRMFGIEEIRDKYPSDISGGQKQRTAVARALMNNPYLILADEPTGNLDSRSSEAVIQAFIEAKKELGATIFMVTHDSFSASFCDRVVVMKDGMVFKELIRTGNRRGFFDTLLMMLRELSGGQQRGSGDDNE